MLAGLSIVFSCLKVCCNGGDSYICRSVHWLDVPRLVVQPFRSYRSLRCSAVPRCPRGRALLLTKAVEICRHGLRSLLVPTLRLSIRPVRPAVPDHGHHRSAQLKPVGHLLVKFVFDPVEVDDAAAWPLSRSGNRLGLDEVAILISCVCVALQCKLRLFVYVSNK